MWAFTRTVLVHISSMSEKFIKDPHQVVKAGDIVKVKVMSVEVERNRIGLSMRLSDDAGTAGGRARPANEQPGQRDDRTNRKQKKSIQKNAGTNESTPSALAVALQESLGKSR